MKPISFKRGRLKWDVAIKTAEEINEQYLKKNWDDGFLAFSKEEWSLNKDGLTLLGNCLSGRADESGGPEGFLMEAGLWCVDGSVHEEISLTRQGKEFLVQHWCLDTMGISFPYLCYYRRAHTFIRGNLTKLFPVPPESIEVIIPDHRLRLYLTVGVTT